MAIEHKLNSIVLVRSPRRRASFCKSAVTGTMTKNRQIKHILES